jgi:regulatory protein
VAKVFTINEILEKAERYCAMQERCIADVIKKCCDWKLDKEQHPQVIDHLLRHNFIDEERFAFAFVRAKFNGKNKGRNRIMYELKTKKIDSAVIEQAMRQIEEGDYREKMTKLAVSKLKSLQKENAFKQRTKLIHYLMQKGYEYDQIKSVINMDGVNILFNKI